MKSRGKNLYEAMDQALDYYKELRQDDLPKYILACDFQDWYLLDKQDNSEYRFGLTELTDNIGLFGFMTDRPKVVKADPVNRDAVIMIGKIFDELKKADFSSGESSYFLTRVVFCLFADDVGIFPERGMFQNYIKNNTVEDGSDTGSRLQYLFDNVLNKHQENRSRNISPKVRFFPYIDGGLFAGGHGVPDFNQNMRKLLIEAGEYDWSKVSPAIFGTMFQTVMDQGARRESGSHYTTEENILKVIRPLFLDTLNDEFDKIDRIIDDSKKDRFVKFQNKLVSMKFLDPACGSGNFLVIAYRELRRIEHKVIVKIHGFDAEKLMDIEKLSKMNVNQFYGIEIGEFSAKIAEISLWMMDHMMNMELSNVMEGLRYRRIPITEKPNIVCRDALEFDWNDMLPTTECDYIFGNPPFSGDSQMTDGQKKQTVDITKSASLDYVSNWFVKACQYTKNTSIQFAFVSTNSIVQGEQVRQLWPQILDDGLEISFAYTQFKWQSDSSDQAQVIVVIIGLARNNMKKRLFEYEDNQIVEQNPKQITPYLRATNTESVIVSQASKPINELPPINIGSKLVDGGHYTFTESEKEEFLKSESKAEKYMIPFFSGQDLLYNKKRYVLALQTITPNELAKLPNVMKKVAAVRQFRLQSKKTQTRKFAEIPKEFCETRIPKKPFLVIPRTTSEKRKYVPFGYVNPPAIPSDANMIIEDASVSLFGLLESKMHMLWLRSFCGRLKTDFIYSAQMVYNTFPVPDDYSSLDSHAQKILDNRAKYPNATLANLYNPITMPSDLKKAHQKLDKAVEKLYRKEPFESDDERLEFLLEKYQSMVKAQTTLD